MIIYQVNVLVDMAIKDLFLHWLEEHIPQMLGFRGFKQARILLEQTEAMLGAKQASSICIEYELESMADLENYFAHQASQMRQIGIDKFGEQFTIIRRIYFVDQVIHRL